MVVSGLVARVAVGQPSLAGLRRDQAVPCRLPEEVLEDEAVHPAVAGEVGREPLPQQFATLFEYEFELLYTGRTEDVVPDVIRVTSFQFAECVFEGGETSTQESGINRR